MELNLTDHTEDPSSGRQSLKKEKKHLGFESFLSIFLLKERINQLSFTFPEKTACSLNVHFFLLKLFTCDAESATCLRKGHIPTSQPTPTDLFYQIFLTIAHIQAH